MSKVLYNVTRNMTSEIFHITCCIVQAHYCVVIATSQDDQSSVLTATFL